MNTQRGWPTQILQPYEDARFEVLAAALLKTAISDWTSVIRSRKSDVLRENAKRQPISHYFKWEKLQCVGTSTQNPQPVP